MINKRITHIVFLMACCLNAFPQNNIVSDVKTRVLECSELYATKFNTRGYGISSQFDDSTSCKITGHTFNLHIKRPSNLDAAYTYFFVADSLAASDNYYNKAFGNQILDNLAVFFIYLEEAIGYMAQEGTMPSFTKINLSNIEEYVKNQDGNATQVTQLLKKVVESYLTHCTHYFSPTFLSSLKAHHFDKDIVNMIGNLLSDPQRTREQAELLIRSSKPLYTLEDTVGFHDRQQQVRNDEADMNTQLFVERVQTHIDNAESRDMSLKEYWESLQLTEELQFIDNYVRIGIQVNGYLDAIGRFKIYELTPIIEESIEMKKINPGAASHAHSVLARLKYKDYEQREINLIRKNIAKLDTTEYDLWIESYRALQYIHTQDAYFAAAPLLLNRHIVYDKIGTVTVGARIIYEMSKRITNLPWKEELKKAEQREGYSIDWEAYAIDRYLPDNFIEKIYHWLVANKGYYKLDD